MTSTPFQDCVAIDTNVFVHLLNPEQNADSHISRLLVHLQSQSLALITDDRGRIADEYERIITPMVENLDESLNERYVLLYWTQYAMCCNVPLDMQDRMMQAIRGVITETSENVDRIFVYVAFKKGKLLITNDEMHIVFGPTRERGRTPRRDRLLRATRRHCPDGADILTSKEAHDKIVER